MDISETYIKMCEKAKEIQDLSFMFDPDDENINNLSACSGHHRVINDSDEFAQHFIKDKETVIWIPRQDQLQEIAFSHIKTYLMHDKPLSLIKWIFDYTWDYQDGGTPQYKGEKFKNCSSLEQIWLMYVMETKYSKIWNGEEWILKP